MNYIETEKYLNSLNSLGSIPGLDSVKELLKRLGNPQNEMKFVHIAGTNGKGSVNSYISEILIKAGYRTGRFISPAVRTPLEIIQCDNKPVTEKKFAEIITRIKSVCDEMVRNNLPHPTRFEIETAAAFMFFCDCKCDIAVVECGMGGLLDATNVIKNTECAVITTISIDHTAFLGNKIEQITHHKAGIIKKGCSVITSTQNKIVNDIIRESCIMGDNSLYEADTLLIKDRKHDKKKLCNYFTYKDVEYCTKMLGTYQTINAVTAIECANALIKRGYKISEKNIIEGIGETSWFGRFSIIGEQPDFIIDGAHNDDGSVALAKCLETYYPSGGLTYIIGVFADKDYEKILNNTLRFANKVVAIETPNNKRALKANCLAKFIEKHYDIQVNAFNDIENAVKFALENTEKDSAVVAFGSLSHLNFIEEAYRKVKDFDR